MASATLNSKPVQMIVTLEDNALIADIKKALKLLRGVASVRMANLKDDETITPAMYRSINKARREYANGETIYVVHQKKCNDISTTYDLNY